MSGWLESLRSPTPTYLRFLPWNVNRVETLWSSTDPAWRRVYGEPAELQAIHDARQRAMREWIRSGR